MITAECPTCKTLYGVPDDVDPRLFRCPMCSPEEDPGSIAGPVHYRNKVGVAKYLALGITIALAIPSGLWLFFAVNSWRAELHHAAEEQRLLEWRQQRAKEFRDAMEADPFVRKQLELLRQKKAERERARPVPAPAPSRLFIRD